MKITPEESARRSELARRLHSEIDPETGRRRFGGAQPGSGRPRNKRAAEIVAEKAKEKADDIVSAFTDALQAGKPDHIRLQAARQWLDVEKAEAELQLKEDRALEGLSTQQLIDEIIGRISPLQDAGYFDAGGSATDEPRAALEAGTPGAGEADGSA